MGAYGGSAYQDNIKYLFKFLNNHSDYKLVWIAKSHELMNEMGRNGYQAVYTYDLEAIHLLEEAKFIYICQSFE